MNDHWISRITLRRDVPAAALAPILLPDEPGARADLGHRLLWTLFSDADGADRFLWREHGSIGLTPGRSHFIALSSTPPNDCHGLFRIDSKSFAPQLAPGDRLGFILRANPVVSRGRDIRNRRGKRHDVVMAALKDVPSGERASVRQTAIETAGRHWLEEQGARHGFALSDLRPLRIDGYERLTIPHGNNRPIILARLDFDGALEISDPARFTTALHQGFGKAKGFGCGLMLVRRI
ncbi:MAG: type I-E CRISPR-associated protein Cas6/Cse3/CasE [Geminicoccaceae bacterium]